LEHSRESNNTGSFDPRIFSYYKKQLKMILGSKCSTTLHSSFVQRSNEPLLYQDKECPVYMTLSTARS